jgi:hypothetical protein
VKTDVYLPTPQHRFEELREDNSRRLPHISDGATGDISFRLTLTQMREGERREEEGQGKGRER